MRGDPYARGLKLSAQGLHAQAIEQFEHALSLNPSDSRTLFALGNTARALGMNRPAQEFYRRVLAIEPERLEALINLANLLRSEGQFEAAEALLAPALARTPDAPELWLTLGSIYRETGDQERAGEYYREAVARRPNYAAALGNLADLAADDGNHRQALALYDRALEVEPDNAQARLNRAVLHLLNGDLKPGWRDYAARLKLPGKAPVPDHNLPRWNGSSLRNTRLLVTAEQGVGDQIMFASMMADLAQRAVADGGTILLECEPRLVALFARSFASFAVRPWDVETRAGIVKAHYGWLKAAGGANAAIEMGSLPRILRNRIEDFPQRDRYLVPDSDEAGRWRAAFEHLPRPLIGVCWRSGSTGGHRALQYAPLDAWAGFLRELPGTIVSAQYDARDEEIAALRAMSGHDIAVPAAVDQKNELDRTAAMLSTLDAMVSAPTAVSWLAAAVGTPTCKTLYDTSWTSFGQRHEPFAPSALCMMPSVRGDWADVFAQTKIRLNALFASY